MGIISSLLADRSSVCYNDQAEAGGGEPRADTGVLHICRSSWCRDLDVGLQLVFD